MGLFKGKHSHQRKEPTTVAIPEMASFGNMKIDINGMKNFTPKQQAKFKEAMAIGELVLNSQQFKDAILAVEKFYENKDMTNMQIYELICSGNDLYDSSNDKDIDVFVTMYSNFWSGVIGYTYRNTVKTWINAKFFNRFEIAEVFGNVLHEALHNMGFQHLIKKTMRKTVPYIIGYIGRDLANKHLNGEIVLTPVQQAA